MSNYIFVRGNGANVVWDVKKSKRLCGFTDGLLKTDDPRTAKILRELGYKEMKDYPDGPPVDGFIPKKTSLLPPKKELSPGSPASPASRPDMEMDVDVEETVIDQKPQKVKKKAPKKLAKTLTKKK